MLFTFNLPRLNNAERILNLRVNKEMFLFLFHSGGKIIENRLIPTAAAVRRWLPGENFLWPCTLYAKCNKCYTYAAEMHSEKNTRIFKLNFQACQMVPESLGMQYLSESLKVFRPTFLPFFSRLRKVTGSLKFSSIF